MAPLSKFIFGLCALLVSQAGLVQALPAASTGHTKRDVLIEENFEPQRNDSAALEQRAGKPFYAIAHHVLTRKAADAALKHGANAIEVDLHAYKDKGWYADHDGIGTWWAGDPAKDFFQYIADQRKAGKTVTFVWFDIKSPNYEKCDPDNASTRFCSIEGLRDLARQILEPAGIRVLYGFTEIGGKWNAYQRIESGLNSNEIIGLDGNLGQVTSDFASAGPADKSKRVYSRGLFMTNFSWSNILSQLQQGVASGQFQQVYGWTVSWKQKETINQLINNAGVNGLIYGYAFLGYADNAIIRSTFADVADAVKASARGLYLATNNDLPW